MESFNLGLLFLQLKKCIKGTLVWGRSQNGNLALKHPEIMFKNFQIKLPGTRSDSYHYKYQMYHYQY